MPQTTVDNLFAEPAYLVAGDATTALGAGLTDFDIVPEVSITARFNRNSAENEIGQALYDGQSGACVGADISLTLHNNQASLMAAIFAEIADQTGAYGFETDFASISGVMLGIIPLSDKAVGITNANTFWVPGFVPDDLGALTRTLQSGSGSQSNSNPFTITGRATYRVDDGNSETLETWARILFRGSTDVALGGSPTTSWSLPSKYSP